MRRLFALLLSLALLCSLVSCGSREADSSADAYDPSVHYASPDLMAEVLGYDMFPYDDASLTLTDCAVLNENIGILTYSTENQSVVTLKMTVDADANESISILSDSTQQQGGVQAPCADFGPLNVYIDKDADLCFCPFTYQEDGYTCYLYLSETGTDFNSGFSKRLITFVNQIYQSSETSSYVTYLDNIAKAKAAAEKAQEEAAKQKEAESSEGDKSQDTDQQPKPDSQDKETPPAEPAEDDEPAQQPETDTAEPEAPAGSITLQYYDITLVNIGDAYTFTPSGGTAPYTWTSADSSVATVSSGGTVTAAGHGQTTVTCSSSDGLIVDIVVRVP